MAKKMGTKAGGKGKMSGPKKVGGGKVGGGKAC